VKYSELWGERNDDSNFFYETERLESYKLSKAIKMGHKEESVDSPRLKRFSVTAVGFDITVARFNVTAVGFGVTVVRFDVTAIGFDVTVISFNVTAVGFNVTTVGFDATVVSFNVNVVGDKNLLG
jgi:hypothetical protein